MADEQPIWRTALNDSEHPLYQAAWIMFQERARVDYAAKTLENQKEQVIPFLYAILDEEALYDETGLGRGMAPVNAVRLLGRWQVTEAADRLWKILHEEEDVESYIYNDTTLALKGMGRAILEPMLQKTAEVDPEREAVLAEILSEIGKGDERAFEWLAQILAKQTDEFDIKFFAEMLLNNNVEAGAEWIEQAIRERKFHRPLHAKLRSLIKAYQED